MSAKTKLKKLLRASDVSDEMVEITRMFILPFSSKVKWRGASIDDVLNLFFNVETRKIFEGTVNRDFQMPGRFFQGSFAAYFIGNRKVAAGSKVIVVVDNEIQTAKIDVITEFSERTFELTRWEFDAIKDRIDFNDTSKGSDD